MDGKDILLEGKDPEFTEEADGKLVITWPLSNVPGTMIISLDEQRMSVELRDGKVKWYLDLQTAESAELPFLNITDKRLDCSFQDLAYHVEAEKGTFSKASGKGFRVNPEKNAIVLNMAERE